MQMEMCPLLNIKELLILCCGLLVVDIFFKVPCDKLLVVRFLVPE